MLLGATDKAHTPLWKKICAGAVSGKYKNKCRERERESESERERERERVCGKNKRERERQNVFVEKKGGV